tara:strand:- start:4390 stop:4587 length:198 start_codon:yes stop_codon:yes gene_type:complete
MSTDKQIKLLKKYADLIAKGVHKWDEKDFSETRQITKDLSAFLGKEKALFALAETKKYIMSKGVK